MTTKQQIKSAKPTHFHERWLKAYGLRVTAQDAATGKICSFECQFCRAFGKEVRRVDAARAPRAKIKMLLYQAMEARSHEDAYA
jgi:hypothetical protein